MIEDLIHSKFGFCPDVLLMSDDEFNLSIKKNPYQGYEGKIVHFYYCKNAPQVDQTKLDKLVSDSENYLLIDRVLYLHAPDGIGRSKLVANLESCLGVSATGRNLNTVNKIKSIIERV